MNEKIDLQFLENGGDLLRGILFEIIISQNEDQVKPARELISEMISEISAGRLKTADNLKSAIVARIAEIDRLLSLQVDEILHHEEFQRLEASWRGLRFLVENSLTGTRLKIRVAAVTKSDLLRDFERSLELRQSWLFRKIYADEYGHFGGTPYTALIGDFEFRNDPRDIFLLKNISQVAAFAHAPFLSAVSPNFFGWKTFSEITDAKIWDEIFDRPDYHSWREFRRSEDARYVGLTGARMLGREPYRKATKSAVAFQFEEDVRGADRQKQLWSSAAYALAARLTEAFAAHGWGAPLRGAIFEELSDQTYDPQTGEPGETFPLEIRITESMSKQLADQGVISLFHQPAQHQIVLEGLPSAYQPRVFDYESANRWSKLSSELDYIFTVSRFAHYLVMVMRDAVVSFHTRLDAQSFLQRWINKFIAGDAETESEYNDKARYPLIEAMINLQDVPARPNRCQAIVFINPRFQIEPLSVALRMVVDLPKRYGEIDRDRDGGWWE